MHSALRGASPGATIISRSGSYRLDPPASVRRWLEPNSELARELFATDRSATYGSFYIFTVKPGYTPSVGRGVPVEQPVEHSGVPALSV